MKWENRYLISEQCTYTKHQETVLCCCVDGADRGAHANVIMHFLGFYIF